MTWVKDKYSFSCLYGKVLQIRTNLIDKRLMDEENDYFIKDFCHFEEQKIEIYKMFIDSSNW